MLVRRGKWEVGEKKLELWVKRGPFGKYAEDASHGCVTDAD